MAIKQGTQEGTKRTLVVQLAADSLGKARLDLCFGLMNYDFPCCLEGENERISWGICVEPHIRVIASEVSTQAGI